MIGERIGSIHLESRLGEGGMGEVFLGFDERLERRVAVKTIRAARRMTPEVKARFLREARLLSRLEHQNICRVYDLVEHEQSDYLILEYLEGRTLKQAMLDDSGSLDLLHLVEEIATALAVAHEQHIVHRDLKPDNIMLTTDGRTKVLDFGLARSVDGGSEMPGAVPEPEPELESDKTVALEPDGRATGIESAGEPDTEDLTRRGSIVGTVRYMSPEQACGEAVTEASDLYALGLILQELATGRPAYEAANSVEMLLRASQAETVPVSGVEPELAELINELTSLEPGARPTAAATINRLRALRNKPGQQRRRRRAVIGAVVVAVLVAVTGVLGYLLARPQPLLDPGGRVALLPFANETGDPRNDWVELGLMQMVAETVDGAEGIDVVAVEQVLQTMSRLGIDRDAEIDESQQRRLMGALGAACMVRSSVVNTVSGFDIRYSVHSPGRRALSKALHTVDLTAGASELADRLVLRLRPEAQPVALQDRFSEDLFANRAYAMGVQQHDVAGPEVASHYFRVSLDRDPEMHWARLLLAGSLHLAGSVEESRSLVEQLLAAPEVLADPALMAAALRQRGTSSEELGEYGEAAAYYEQAIAIVGRAGDRDGLVSGLACLAGVKQLAGDLEAAERHWLEAMAQAEAGQLVDWQSRLLNNLAYVSYERGDLDGAEELWTECISYMRETGNRVGEALILGNLGIAADDRGDLETALAYHRQELELQRQLGVRQTEAVAAFNYAGVLRRLGDLERAEAEMAGCLEVASEVEHRMIEVLCGALLGHLVARRGDLREGARLALAAMELAEEVESPQAILLARVALADVKIGLGELAAADELLSSVEPVENDAEIMMVRARWQSARGRVDRALAIAEAAREAAGVQWSPNLEAELQAYRAANKSSLTE